MIIFKKNIFDQDTNELIWRKNTFYSIKRGNVSQMLLENETQKDYGLDPNDVGTFCEIVDCDGEVDVKCLKCGYCYSDDSAFYCTIKKFKGENT